MLQVLYFVATRSKLLYNIWLNYEFFFLSLYSCYNVAQYFITRFSSILYIVIFMVRKISGNSHMYHTEFESSFKITYNNVSDHTDDNNWFHRVAGPSIYRALTTRFLILCSWTAYAFPHHLSLLQCNVRSIFSFERGFHFSFSSHLRNVPSS